MLINRKTNIVFHQERYLHSLIHLFLVFLLSHYHSFPAEPFLNWKKKKARFKRNRTIAIGQQYYATNKTKEKLFSSILKKKKRKIYSILQGTHGEILNPKWQEPTTGILKLFITCPFPENRIPYEYLDIVLLGGGHLRMLERPTGWHNHHSM